MLEVPTLFLRNGTHEPLVHLTEEVINNPSIPKELVPVITLIKAQQARRYFDCVVEIPEDDGGPNLMAVNCKLNGIELVFWQDEGFQPIYINVTDAIAECQSDGVFLKLSDAKNYFIKTANAQDLNMVYASLLLAKFEFTQLQLAFTGALLSSKAILLSDIRTLLAPENRFVKAEWCIVRFPWLNNKWIRCYVVVTPPEKNLSSNFKIKDDLAGFKPGKIEIYASKQLQKKNLLACIVNGQSCSTIFPEQPDFIDSNSLLRVQGDILVNQDKLQQLSEESLNRKKSSSSLRKNNSWSRLSASNRHNRSSSVTSNESVNSTGSSFTSRQLKSLNFATTNLCYLMPESHSAVLPLETMIRVMLPIMNSFKLYGRPLKFSSSKQDPDSLLFGLPQLPHTNYLDVQTAITLVELNLDNSRLEGWSEHNWNSAFKEMVSLRFSQGFSGTGDLSAYIASKNYTKVDLEQSPVYSLTDEQLNFIDRSPRAPPKGDTISSSLGLSGDSLSTVDK